MKLSIIVPVYNAEKYLRPCVDSILEQELQDFELLLMDDGSRDGSAAILAAYQERFPQVIKVVTLENGGQGRAKNIGLSMAQGDYVGFVDSDDYIKPAMFQKLLSAAEEQDADIVVCDFEREFPDGKRQHEVWWDEQKPLYAAGACWNKLFRRDFIGGIRHPEGLWYEDFSFSSKLFLKAERVAYVNEALYVYRVGQPSTMNNNNTRKNLDILTVMDDLKHFLGGEQRGSFEYLLINHVLLDAIKRVALQDTEERDRVLRQLRSYVKKEIPKLSACPAYRQESRNRRIIMALNYHGLHVLSLKLLHLK